MVIYFKFILNQQLKFNKNVQDQNFYYRMRIRFNYNLFSLTMPMKLQNHHLTFKVIWNFNFLSISLLKYCTFSLIFFVFLKVSCFKNYLKFLNLNFLSYVSNESQKIIQIIPSKHVLLIIGLLLTQFNFLVMSRNFHQSFDRKIISLFI